MVKFHDRLDVLNHEIVGREKSVQREVKLLTKLWAGESGKIKRHMHKVKNRTFVSIYLGRKCVGTIFFIRLNKSQEVWSLSHAIIHPSIRGKGIGTDLAHLGIKFAFKNGCSKLYLAAQCSHKRYDDEKEKNIYESKEESGAYRFWKKLSFKYVSHHEFKLALKTVDKHKNYDYEGMIPLKMTHQSRAARAMPDIRTSINTLFNKLDKISKNKKRRKVPLVRLCGHNRDVCILGD